MKQDRFCAGCGGYVIEAHRNKWKSEAGNQICEDCWKEEYQELMEQCREITCPACETTYEPGSLAERYVCPHCGTNIALYEQDPENPESPQELLSRLKAIQQQEEHNED